MVSLTRSINFERPHEVLETSSSLNSAGIVADSSSMHASTPTITTFDDLAKNDLLQKIGASILNSIQLKHKLDTTATEFQPSSNALNSNMDLDFTPNRVVIDSSSFNAMDELQKQLEYDKFMNEVWIGIVFTLILISMIFCICSCFLYHQFRTWKRNYHQTTSQCASVNDVEAMKLQPDFEDPVPEYTLVSGLPSYEAALELLHKTPQSCLIVYPSVFNVFNRHERVNVDGLSTTTTTAAPGTASATTPTTPTATMAQQQLSEVTMPLLAATTPTTATATATIVDLSITTPTSTPTREVIKPNLMPIPSYTEAMSYKMFDEKRLASTITTTTTTPIQTQTTATTTTIAQNKSENSLLTLTHKNQSDKC